MPRCIQLGLYGEGPTDADFLGPVLRRTVLDICQKESVEIPEEVIDLYQSRPKGQKERAVSIAESAKLFPDLALVFVHADGDGSPQTVLSEQCQPGIARVHRLHTGSIRGVAVVPVRETEAWALVDGDAVRSVTGSRLGDLALELPQKPSGAERITDPKQALSRTLSLALPKGRHRHQEGPRPYYSQLGEEVSLKNLRQLPSFLTMEGELVRSLREMGLLQRA